MRRTLRACLLLIALALLAFAFLAWQVDRLGRQDHARRSDAIVVLGARVNADGRPGSDLTSRTYHAVDLWQAGYAPYLICTGGYRDEPLSAAAVCRQLRDRAGRAGRARAAWPMAAATRLRMPKSRPKVIADHGWRTAILVSHPLHLFRARWLFRRAGVDAVTSPTATETDAIFLPLRLWYDVREAGAIVLTTVDGWAWLPAGWVARLQTWSYGLP